MEHIGTRDIRTERLILRKFSKDDCEDMFSNYCSSENVAKYVTWDAHKDIGTTKEYLNDIVLKQYENVDCYRWAICLKDDNKVIGGIDFVDFDEKNETATIGYCLSDKFWNKGIMSEALRAVIDYAFEKIELKTLIAKHVTQNVASGKVMLKCGLEYVADETTLLKGVERELKVYKIKNKRKTQGGNMKITYLGKSEKGIESYKIENANGAYAIVVTYGARIAKLCVRDKNGNLVDVVAGFENPDELTGDNPYFNAVVGRVCNRIGGAKFTLDGKEYNLFKNDGNNHLHGGKVGFDSRMWQAQIVDGKGLKLSRVSSDGEEGYPANLTVSVTYSLSDENALRLEYEAVADNDTLCSLTNHAYFNLDGDFKSVLAHKVFIDSDEMTTVDDELIPHGERKNIIGTAFDFSTEKTIGKDIKADEHMLKIARGYDFNYVLRGGGFRLVATAKGEKSGIKMSVFTDRPCMQFYTGNFLDGIVGKKTYGYQSAFCMETQGYPNACNVPSFESVKLEKGKTYFACSEYKFDVE